MLQSSYQGQMSVGQVAACVCVFAKSKEFTCQHEIPAHQIISSCCSAMTGLRFVQEHPTCGCWRCCACATSLRHFPVGRGPRGGDPWDLSHLGCSHCKTVFTLNITFPVCHSKLCFKDLLDLSSDFFLNCSFFPNRPMSFLKKRSDVVRRVSSLEDTCYFLFSYTLQPTFHPCTFPHVTQSSSSSHVSVVTNRKRYLLLAVCAHGRVVCLPFTPDTVHPDLWLCPSDPEPQSRGLLPWLSIFDTGGFNLSGDRVWVCERGKSRTKWTTNTAKWRQRT